MESETGFLSLSELAALQTDEIKELTSRVPDEGMFLVKGTDVKVSETKTEGKPPLFRINFMTEILKAQPLREDKDVESYVGRGLREGFTLWPDDFNECVGLAKGRYKTVGLSNEGSLGGVEGQAPGWLDNLVGHIFWIRVRHGTDKNNNVRAYYDWFPKEEEGEEGEEAA